MKSWEKKVLKVLITGSKKIKTAPVPARAEVGLIAIHVEKPKAAEKNAKPVADRRVKRENTLDVDQHPVSAPNEAIGERNQKKPIRIKSNEKNKNKYNRRWMYIMRRT